MVMINEPGYQSYVFTPEEKRTLKRRIEEEAGPVKTYPIIEWFDREKAPKERMTVSVGKKAVMLNKLALEAIGGARTVRLGWDNLKDGLVIAPADPDDASAYTVNKAGQITSRSLVKRVAERLPHGRYFPVLEDSRLFVTADQNTAKGVSAMRHRSMTAGGKPGSRTAPRTRTDDPDN